MPSPSTASLREFLSPASGPCVSVYLPTHRRHPDNQQDPIRFRNQVDQIERTLRAADAGRDVKGLTARLRSLADDREFWNHTSDGLVVLASPDRFEVFRLPRTVPERTVVADSFHLKPLWRFAQSADRFHVLALTRDTATIYEGNRYGLEPIPDGLPTHYEAIGGETTAQEKAAFHAGDPQPARNREPGSRKVELDVTRDRFFLAIRDAVLTRYSHPSRVPLVLVALPDNASEFLKVAQNPHLVPDYVPKDPGSLSTDDLRQQAWKRVEPIYLDRLARLTEDFGTALARGSATKDVSEVGKAAAAARVGVLLVEAERVVPGSVDPTSGSVRAAAGGEADDVLDDLAEWTLRTGGEVVVVPAERMPTDTGVAAIFRF